MTNQEAAKMYQAISEAVHEAIAVVGIDGVKAMSMFPSSSKSLPVAKLPALAA